MQATQERLARYDRLVRRLRQRIFDYEGPSEVKADRALRRAVGIQGRLYRRLNPAPIDQWGATWQDRAMLARHGIAWGD